MSQGKPPFSEVADLIEPTVTAMGYDLVQVRVLGQQRRTLQVMAEPLDRTRRMTVDDCALLSHALSAVLDVADPIAGAYQLEVSSPGIDRPLVRREDFVRFTGHQVRLESETPIGGRKRFKGLLKGVADADVLIEVEGELVRVPMAAARKARLVLTEALLKAAAGAR